MSTIAPFGFASCQGQKGFATHHFAGFLQSLFLHFCSARIPAQGVLSRSPSFVFRVRPLSRFVRLFEALARGLSSGLPAVISHGAHGLLPTRHRCRLRHPSRPVGFVGFIAFPASLNVRVVGCERRFQGLGFFARHHS